MHTVKWSNSSIWPIDEPCHILLKGEIKKKKSLLSGVKNQVRRLLVLCWEVGWGSKIKSGAYWFLVEGWVGGSKIKSGTYQFLVVGGRGSKIKSGTYRFLAVGGRGSKIKSGTYQFFVEGLKNQVQYLLAHWFFFFLPCLLLQKSQKKKKLSFSSPNKGNCKTIEYMVNKRLVWFIESNNFITNSQCGFRKQRSTVALVVNLETFIREANIWKQYLIAV